MLNVGNDGPHCYEFGRFQLDSAQRLLLRDGQPVALQPKALDILLLLVRNPGKAITKEELLSTVWPGLVVEESNLTQNIFLLRKALGEGEGGHRYIVTLPRLGYQFAEPVTRRAPFASGVSENPLNPLADAAAAERGNEPPRRSFGTLWFYVLPATVIALITVLILMLHAERTRSLHAIAASDTVVLADLTNSTGDSVFDGTLRQALAAQLEQSPLLNLLSDQRIATTLALMGTPKDSTINGQVAAEICQRTGSAIVIDGDIAQLGSQYLITLSAAGCGNGDALGRAQARARTKDQVLDALGAAAATMRARLGESRGSIQKYDAPPEAVTTPSLDALHAYSAAYRTMIRNNDYPGAIPLFERAIALDPDFAMAYARLGINFYNLGEPARAEQSLKHAYELSGRLSEREQLYISSSYDAMARRDFVAARQSYELWSQMYPRDQFAVGNLGVVYCYLGDYQKGLAAMQRALELNPQNALVFANVVGTLMQLNRLDEARAMASKAHDLGLLSGGLHAKIYMIDFLQGNMSGMQQQADALLSLPGWSDVALHAEANTATYAGEFVRARELTRLAVQAAVRDDKTEAAATYQAESAVREALVGNGEQAVQQASAALALSEGKTVQIFAAIAYAAAGALAPSHRLTDALSQGLPKDTVYQFNAAPTIQAAGELWRGDAGRAIQTLQVAQQFELGQTDELASFTMYPVYWRAQAYLAAGRAEAATEFQKIAEHSGLVQNELIGALAQLGLARAYRASKDTERAKQAYQAFLSNWAHADKNLPILRLARSEYSSLR